MFSVFELLQSLSGLPVSHIQQQTFTACTLRSAFEFGTQNVRTWAFFFFTFFFLHTWICTVCSCFSRPRRASSSSSCCSSKLLFSASSWRIWPLRLSFCRVSSWSNSYPQEQHRRKESRNVSVKLSYDDNMWGSVASWNFDTRKTNVESVKIFCKGRWHRTRLITSSEPLPD